MLLNARVTAFNVSELLRENQQGGGGEGVKKVELFTEIFKSLTIFRKTNTLNPLFNIIPVLCNIV